MTHDLTDFLGDVGPIVFYLAVWGLVFSGTALFVGVFIPFITGDSLLFAAGLLTGTHSELSIWVLAIGVAIAAVLGDQVGFWFGRRLGRPHLARRGGRWVQAGVRKAERFYELFGWWSVVISRYIPWGRVFIPPIAGISAMKYWRFFTANVVGALSWGVLITVIGYFAAVNPSVRPIAYLVAGVVILASIVAGIRAWVLDRRSRSETVLDASVESAGDEHRPTR